MNYQKNEIFCRTTQDVLDHKIIKDTLLEIVNEYSWDRDDISKTWEWSEDDTNLFNTFVLDIFRDTALYSDFEARLQYRYKRFKSRFPYRIEPQYIMAALTTLDYVRTAVNMLPITIEDTNKKLIDIMNYDSYLVSRSTQIRREDLLRDEVPLVDENGLEVVEYDRDFDPEFILSYSVLFGWHKLLSIKRNIDNDFVLMTFLWKILKLQDKEVSPDSVYMVIYTVRNMYLKLHGMKPIINQDGEELIDSEWNQINEILWTFNIWLADYMHVKSNKSKTPYYLNCETFEPLYIDNNQSRLVSALSDYDNKRSTYKAVDINWKICIIDDEWYEIGNTLSLVSQDFTPNLKQRNITPLKVVK